jgi:pyruvate dehydrogenase E2 component (dihydrolipoamide acetyltransferase)
MATEIKLPMLGENVDSATVVKILVSVGDTITEDQPVMELETEKASAEVPASASGTVKEIRIKEGETIKVGQVILTLEEGTEAREAKDNAEGKPEDAKEQKKAESEKVTEEKAEAGPEEAAQKEEQKAPPEAKPEEEAVSEQAAAQEEEKLKAAPPPKPKTEAKAKPEKERAKKEEEKEAPPQREEKVEAGQREEREVAPEPARDLAPAAPSVRRMARELGVNINEVTGTGPGGRISEDDVRNYARSIILNASSPRAATQRTAAPLPDFSRWGEVERTPMTGVRRKTAEHLQDAWTSIPHVTHFDSADITELEQLRERFAKKVEEAGGKLTVTAIALKVTAEALKVFPQFNASLDSVQEEIIYKKYCHIGIAVDTDRGLLVPVIRDVDKKNILDLSVELTQVSEKARSKKLTLEEMQGGTFTITNLGGIGGTSFTPIINSPEVAILGISRASQQPIFSDGQFKPRLMLPLALSYDHRLIDGADAARFLRWVGAALQEPFLLALEG